MPRANRYYLPSCIWHLTHRCHQRKFLLKFARDRRAWEGWLFEARKRFGLSVLNYMVTSNHVHLLVCGGEDRQAIPRAVQLLAGRTGQQYNQRKHRTGAFWEDRYHATAVESGEHLGRCLSYINMNMVRAGVVEHPAEWEHSGYHEIDRPPERYARIDRALLAGLLGLSGPEALAEWQRAAVDRALYCLDKSRCPEWTEGIAVGSAGFVGDVQHRLGVRAYARNPQPISSGAIVLKESALPYGRVSEGENEALSIENRRLWNVTC